MTSDHVIHEIINQELTPDLSETSEACWMYTIFRSMSYRCFSLNRNSLTQQAMPSGVHPSVKHVLWHADGEVTVTHAVLLTSSSTCGSEIR